ncbi:8-oxo-dGTP diphosphatase [Cytospora paraplurivora]|uniref:8-oxo-dGTP diphosphatase n=1 Tax=Cytospora paraplurivora TaxID=2898453 RepID=A0AAN9YHE7_9PEZI
MNGIAEQLSNGHHPPEPSEHGDSAPPTEVEVQEIVQSIRDASAPSAATSTSPPTPALESNLDEGAYWDLSSMAPLNTRSRAAIARLRAYKPPPFPLWDRLPVSRRAAVLILLYADRKGDLRVVLTMRAASLRSFSDQIARREAWEEIGLPVDDAKIPKPFRIEHLCYLPHSLAKTELAVRPCVALLHSPSDLTEPAAAGASPPAPTVDESLIPRLDAKEVAAVFSGPLHNFLLAEDEVLPGEEGQEGRRLLPGGQWYEGRWAEFHDSPWRIHYFHVPVNQQRVSRPEAAAAAAAREGGLAALSEQPEEEADEAQRYLVWGMTGRMLVDTARVAYAREPEFEHSAHFGDEAIIERLAALGRLGEKQKRPAGSELVQEEVKKAAREGGKM